MEIVSMPRCSLWSVVLILSVLLDTSGMQGDPQNLVQNGDFEIEAFQFKVFPQLDVIYDGTMAYIPFFQVVYGGCQVLDGNEYSPNPSYGGVFLIHMNYRYGPGVLHTTPLVTPRKGATYHLSFDMADNPDGGPLYKIIQVTILVNNQISSPTVQPFNVSAPQTERNSILWVTLGFNFVGTGEYTVIQFESLVAGSFGALIDNVNVTLINLVDNGSFETIEGELPVTDTSFFTILEAPSDTIRSWTVSNGQIKRAGLGRWQASTDDSSFMLDLNANDAPGTITSASFATKPDYEYALLFDIAANPDDTPLLKGVIFSSVLSQPGGALLASSSVVVNADGFSTFSMGWQTYKLDFTAQESLANLQFISKIPGSDGPLLDNVLVYEIVPVGDYKSVPLTYAIASAPLTASGSQFWVSILAAGCHAALHFLKLVIL